MSQILHRVNSQRYKVKSVTELLAEAEPTDGKNWPEIFEYIERNHYEMFPEYWDRFLQSIQKFGIKTPLRVEWRRGFKTPERLVVANGHHRLWGAVKTGIIEAPIIEVDRSMSPRQWNKIIRDQNFARDDIDDGFHDQDSIEELPRL